MKPMVQLSAGLHLFLLAGLFVLHHFEWKQPKIKPHILSVQLLSLPQPRLEEKTFPSEPVKKAEPVAPPKIQKKTAPPHIKLKPLPRSVDAFPVKSASKEAVQPIPVVQPEVENSVSPLVETKKEETVPVEIQKVEIAQISEINPNYADWVKRKIESNWNPLSFKGAPKEVTLSFDILKTGLVKFPKIIKSSGDPFFDQAAQRAVVESRSFGPLPADYPNLSVEITCTFSQNKGS
ncbi:MAG: TonB family protein [Nitrospirae bacterium]|nr:TonB family protein [Nitrospirota bacterium]MBI3353205.1 TonB family protein [Nitrospirota bacterium]